jgi:hypothetical protein
MIIISGVMLRPGRKRRIAQCQNASDAPEAGFIVDWRTP